MTIKVHKVEGKTAKAGAKQGRTYKIISESYTKGFFNAITETGKEMIIWNVYGNWSRIGICKKGNIRYSYTSFFEIN